MRQTLYMEIDPIAPGDENGDDDDTFDRAIWLDRQEILQKYNISVGTLANWRKAGLRMRKFGKKYFYHIKDVERFFAEKNKKKERQFKWPISVAWTGFWIVETILIFASKDPYVKLFTMAIPVIIVVPADIIIRIRKRRNKN